MLSWRGRGGRPPQVRRDRRHPQDGRLGRGCAEERRLGHQGSRACLTRRVRICVRSTSPTTRRARSPPIWASPEVFDRMKVNAPGLFETNVRHWMMNEPKARVIRGLADPSGDMTGRGWMSDRFRRLDHFIEIARTLLPEFDNLRLGPVPPGCGNRAAPLIAMFWRAANRRRPTASTTIKEHHHHLATSRRPHISFLSILSPIVLFTYQSSNDQDGRCFRII